MLVTNEGPQGMKNDSHIVGGNGGQEREGDAAAANVPSVPWIQPPLGDLGAPQAKLRMREKQMVQDPSSRPYNSPLYLWVFQHFQPCLRELVSSFLRRREGKQTGKAPFVEG